MVSASMEDIRVLCSAEVVDEVTWLSFRLSRYCATDIKV